ncbi:MAG: FAD binding domain-containing protein, partial [Candidatus Bathyarchaeia archaeon]
MKRFEHFNAKTIDEAILLLEKYDGEAKVIAGGTDLIRVLKDDILPKYPKAIINLKTIANLEYIKEENGVLKIGSLTRLSDVASSSLIKTKYNLLSEACRSVGTPQIRNMGTIGGNLCQDVQCWYYRASKSLGK